VAPIGNFLSRLCRADMTKEKPRPAPQLAETEDDDALEERSVVELAQHSSWSRRGPG